MIRSVRSWVLAGCVGVGAVTACTSAEEPAARTEQNATELDRFEWLEKTAKVLRNGVGLGPNDDVAALAQTPQGGIVDQWMQDPRFGDMALAFNLYYLGRSVDEVKRPLGTSFAYDPVVAEFPQALMAARAAMSGGNYFDLYAGNPDFVFPQKDSSFVTGDPAPEGERERVIALMDAAIETASTDRAGGCAKFVQAGLRATNRMRFLKFPPALTIRHLWLSPSVEYPLALDCTADSGASTDQVVASMRAVRGGIAQVWKAVEERGPESPVKTIADIATVPVAVAGLPPIVSSLGRSYFRTLTSTSTNFQRKRSAFMLKTYFCDDLTPLDIPAAEPGDAGEADIHASNPSCQACHYRLDPMGALFRDIGQNGRDFAGEGQIRFDDQIVFEGDAYDRYLSQWRNPNGTYRAGYWVLGRDGKPERERGWTDADGDRLRGLWSYMRRSKTVKACLVRRLAEYVLGPRQVYDREWLSQISEGLSDGPQSGAQFKAVVKSLVLSKTFAIHNPEKGVCYDVPASAPPNRAPCAVAQVVSANCAGCHSSSAGPGKLDFTQWKDLGGGTFSWTHLDANGSQLSRTESLKRILDRITTPDRQKRMPLLRAMPGDDFTTFKDWLTATIEEPTP